MLPFLISSLFSAVMMSTTRSYSCFCSGVHLAGHIEPAGLVPLVEVQAVLVIILALARLDAGSGKSGPPTYSNRSGRFSASSSSVRKMLVSIMWRANIVGMTPGST